MIHVLIHVCFACDLHAGDMRMFLGGLGEDPNKVNNIVQNNMSRFHKLYARSLMRCSLVSGVPLGPLLPEHYTEPLITQDISHDGRVELCRRLPRPLQLPASLLPNTAASAQLLGSHVRGKISQIVWRTSWGQTAKGVATAGPVKAVRYALGKIAKALRR
eukprot:c8121_g1_i2.p2 GENE.c8121_g1_i2~~c8121_g1_i2.p2  ORF type:complete len:160 (+),score=32.99 c8121_g1_i2:623-1102(+)